MVSRHGQRNVRRTGAVEERALLELLSAALSAEERQRVLACALLTVKEKDLDRLVTRLGPETGGTLKDLLARLAKSPKGAKPVVGSAKVLEDWRQAWEEWWECVAESSAEHGKYVIQEYDWEEPYLDSGALSSDLEPIAGRIRKLIGRFFDEDLDPVFDMAMTFVDTAAEIGCGLSDWMDPSGGDGMQFGKEATRCLLEWEWRAAKSLCRSAYDFVKRIRGTELSEHSLALDGDAVALFIGGLGKNDQRTILDGLSRERDSQEWSAVLSTVYSPWFRIYQDLCRSWDPNRYLLTCREGLKQDWTFALPVIDELVEKGDFAGALAIAEEGASSFLHRRGEERWYPGNSLLVSEAGVSPPESQEKQVKDLLKRWLQAAEALDRRELVWALKIQLAVYTRPADWDSILAEFRRVPPSFGELRERLFTEWEAWVSEECLGRRPAEGKAPRLTWIHGLLRAVDREGDSAVSFRKFLEGWLEAVGETRKELERELCSLSTLTLDLDRKGELRRRYPSLYRRLSKEKKMGGDIMDRPRRLWLERCKGQALLPKVIAFWKNSAAQLVPDPAHASYDDCAAWLAAVKELDPSSFGKIAKRWKLEHRRRKNLWKAIAQQGLALREFSPA